VDLLVVGGGITGAGVARDAAMRGFRTVLIDKGDFAVGTSSSSSRLVHGGLRYLEHYHWHLVFEACRERRTLLKIAPHLVWPRSFLFPVYKGARVPWWKLIAGMWLYDVLALFRNVRRHEWLGKRGLARAEPGLRSLGLKGGARYYDAQCDDARLTLANVRDAERHGATVANYVALDQIETPGGRVAGAQVTDLVTGRSFTVRAHVVVNATGPWSDAIRGVLGDPPQLLPSKGIHIVVRRRRLGNHEALTLTSPIDGRVMFMIPWGGLSYIGTTETPVDAPLEDLRASGADVVYLLRSANAFFPEARLTPDDVLATWAGVRPLLRQEGTDDPNAASREHRILEHESGLLSIVGGKLTTFRSMAAEAVDRVAARLREADGRRLPPRARTDREPLPGGDTHDLEPLVEATLADGFPAAVARHLVHTYGTEAPAVTRLAQSNPRLAEPVVPGHQTLWAELLYAMRREMAVTLGDMFIRRTHLFYAAPEETLAVAPAVADLAMGEMDWDEPRRTAELAAYEDEVNRSVGFRADLEGGS
jgi:glycerol-3-phosphate dehydrogenase